MTQKHSNSNQVFFHNYQKIKVPKRFWHLEGENDSQPMAYLRVHSCATRVYFDLSVLKILAMSGTRGSSGFGSVNSEHIDKRTTRKTNFYELVLQNVLS